MSARISRASRRTSEPGGACEPGCSGHGARRGPGRGRARSSSGSSSCRCQRSRFCAGCASATRSSRWSTSSLSSREAGSCSARGRSGSRSAARAMASASIGSDLPRVRALRPGPRPSASAAPAPPLPGAPAAPAPGGWTRAGSPRRRTPPRPRRTPAAPTAAAGDARHRWPAPSRLAQLPADLVDGDGGVRALWTSIPSMHHGGVSFLPERDSWVGRRTHLSGGDATLLSSHAGRP